MNKMSYFEAIYDALNIKLNKDTAPSSLPKDVDKYLMILILELIQDLEKFNNSFKHNKT